MSIRTVWSDDTEVGNVLGPVVVSPALVAQLDALDTVPGVTCLWMTDWTPEMRARMRLFPGRDWPRLERADKPASSRSWWKFAALHAWLTELAANVAEEEFYGSLVWLDDDLNTWTIRAACKRLLRPLGLDMLLIAPRTELGVTPAEMMQVGEWIKAHVAKEERHRLDEAWRISPVARAGASGTAGTAPTAAASPVPPATPGTPHTPPGVTQEAVSRPRSGARSARSALAPCAFGSPPRRTHSRTAWSEGRQSRTLLPKTDLEVCDRPSFGP